VSGIRPILATVVAAVLPGVGVAVLAWHGREVAAWLDAAEPVVAIGAVFVVGALLTGLALLPTHAVSLGAGYAFGAWLGPMVAWSSIVSATLLAYVVGRWATGDRFAAHLRERPRWRAVVRGLLDESPARATWLIALVRLSPVAPFAATNVALAGLRTPLPTYFVGAAVGLLPRIVAVAWFGAGLATLDWQRPTSVWMLAVGGLATVVALWIVGRVAARELKNADASVAAG
jgi:uncharacterized membrane protein YdjX (TVP38/TMEM64 family)